MQDSHTAILTLNWNGLEHLIKFIPSALSQTHENFFLVIVDNGSNDASIEYVKTNYPEVVVLQLNENRGYSKGFNHGIQYCIDKGVDYILITNNDLILDSNFLSSGLELARTDNRIGYMSGKVYHLDDPQRFQYAGGREEYKNNNWSSRGSGELDIGQYEEIMDFDFMDDVCSIVNANMIKDIGSYDEDFTYDFEETEWNYRIRKNGYRIVYNPQMKAWHRKHGSTGGNRYNPYSVFHHWRGKMIFHYKVRRNLDFVMFCLTLLFINLPVHFGVLIKNRKTFLIYHNLSGISSGFRRIVELK